MSTISIALSSLFGVLAGGYISDRWVLKMYVEEYILVLWVWGLSYLPCCLSDMVILFLHWSWERCLFGIGFGMFDANNMPILCQFVSARYRATAYGIMNMCGVFCRSCYY